MKIKTIERIFIAVAVIILFTTLLVYFWKTQEEAQDLPADNSFYFAPDEDKSAEKDGVAQENVPRDSSADSSDFMATAQIENTEAKVAPLEPAIAEPATQDPRNGLAPIPEGESDLERIKRLIAPLPKGEAGTEYVIRVFKDKQLVCVFEDKKADGSFDYLIHAFEASTAGEGYETPSGEHKIGIKYLSGFMIDSSYAKYCSEFLQYHYFHGLPSYGGIEESGVSWKDYNKLGQSDSHGCIRVTTRAAKWIYENCPENTRVEILEDSKDYPYLPEKIDRLWMSEDGPTWDPTNDNPNNPYQQDPSLLLPYNKQEN